MLISEDYGLLIILGWAIIFTLLAYLILTILLPSKQFIKKRILWAGLLGFLLTVPLIGSNKIKLVIINEHDNKFFHTEFYMVGNIDIQLNNSKTYNSKRLKKFYYESESQKLNSIILNNTDSALFISELQYVYKDFKSDHESWLGSINPDTFFLFSQHIYYYFGVPPYEIEDDDTNPISRFWLFRDSDLDRFLFTHKDEYKRTIKQTE